MAGEQFGMRAVDLAGAEADTSAMQIEGLAKAGGQGLGQAVDGYNQANFNQAIQDGEAYLNQMADELDIPPENRDMIKFFSGNPESVKAGAKFLMDSTEQQRKDTGVKNILGLSQGINEKYKGLSADIFNKEGMTPEEMKAAQEQLISDKSGEMTGLKIGSKDKYDLAGYDAVFGGGSGTWQEEVARAKLEDTDNRAVIARKKLAMTKEDIVSKRKIGALKAMKLGSSTGIRAMSRVGEELVKSIDKSLSETKNGNTPGFMPFGSLQLAPKWVQSLVAKMNKNEKAAYSAEHKRQAEDLRNSIGRYLDRYKKFISGTAVSDQEYNKLMNNLAASPTNSFGEFLDAVISMTEQAQNTYADNWNDVDTMYMLPDRSHPLSSSGIKNPADFMGKQLDALKKIRLTVDDKQVFDGSLFYKEKGLSPIVEQDRINAEKEKNKETKAADVSTSNGYTLNDLGVEEITTGGVTTSTKPIRRAATLEDLEGEL